MDASDEALLYALPDSITQVMESTGCLYDDAAYALIKAKGDIPRAIRIIHFWMR